MAYRTLVLLKPWAINKENRHILQRDSLQNYLHIRTVHADKSINRFIWSNAKLMEPVVTFVKLNPINFPRPLLNWRVL